MISSGHNKAAEINAAIALAAAGTPSNVYLSEGVFILETPIVLLSGVTLVGAGSKTILVPTYTGSAEDPTNCVISCSGELNTSVLNTTLSTKVAKGASSITVASAGTIAAGNWIVIEGTNAVGDESGGVKGGNLGELVKVDSSYVSGTTIPLAWPLYQNHGVTGVTVKAVTPRLNVGVTDLRLMGGQSVTTASGCYFKYCSGVVVDRVSGEGFTRAAVEVVRSKDFSSSKFYNRGNSNCWFILHSVVNFDVSGFDGAEGVARQNASGLPRAAIWLQHRCTEGRIYSGSIVGGYAGLYHNSGVNLVFDNIQIRNQVITEAVYNRAVAGGEFQSGTIWVLGFGSGLAPLGINEFSYGCVYSNLITKDLVGPNVDAWNNATPRRGVSFMFQDSYRATISGITCNNWITGNPISGVVLSDCDGTAQNISVKGCFYGITCKNTLTNFKIDGYRFDGVLTGAFANIPIFLDYSPTSGRGPHFDGVQVSNCFSLIRFGGEFAYDPYFEIRDLTTDGGRWDHVVLANNATVTAFTTGDVVEIDGANTGTDLRVITPDTGHTDYHTKLVAVASGQTDDPGTGFLLVAPLPQAIATVMATATDVAYGDRLGYAATRKVATAAGAAQPLGKALTRKATGSAGLVIIGPAA